MDSHHKFLRVGDHIFNLQYIKDIKCDDKKCSFFVANTQTASGRFNYKTNNDAVYVINKMDKPGCYAQVKRFYDSDHL